eukprot:4617652-Prymnesium_polylepis.1
MVAPASPRPSRRPTAGSARTAAPRSSAGCCRACGGWEAGTPARPARAAARPAGRGAPRTSAAGRACLRARAGAWWTRDPRSPRSQGSGASEARSSSGRCPACNASGRRGRRGAIAA